MTRFLVRLMAALGFAFLFATVAAPLSVKAPDTDSLRERVRKSDIIVLGTTQFVLPPLLTGTAGSIVGFEVDSVLAITTRASRARPLPRGRVIRIRADQQYLDATALATGQWIWFLRSNGDSTFHTVRAHPVQAPRLSREATALIDSLGGDRASRKAPLRGAFEAFLLGEESRLPSNGSRSFMNVAPMGK